MPGCLILFNMKKTILGYIKYISRRNLILPIIVLAVMLVLIIVLPIKDVLLPVKVSSIDEIIAANADGNSCVKLEMEDLTYTGYDYYVNYQPKASYYYVLNEDTSDDIMCIFFLLPSGESAKADTISHFSAPARIQPLNSHSELFIEDYCKDIGWTGEGLKTACGGILVSSYDYHATLYVVLAVLIILIIIISLAYIIANLVIIADPTRHEACRRLMRFGLDAHDFRDIDEELAHDRIVSAGNLFITYHYLICFGKHSIFVVPLFNIIWAYKFSSWNRFTVGKLRYTLVVVTSPKDKIQVPGNRKKDVDKILKFLEEDFSNITIGYTEEIREEVEKQLQMKSTGSEN